MGCLGNLQPRRGPSGGSLPEAGVGSSWHHQAVNAPLSGFRIVDLTVDRGELCARVLGDLGAEVIKVEPPEGSRARGLAPLHAGTSLFFAVRNAGKKGVALDLESAEGLDRLHELLAHSDAVIQSSEAGEGLDAYELSARHPHLVVTSITAYGLTGPWSGPAGHRQRADGDGHHRVQGGHSGEGSALPAGEFRRRRRRGHVRVRDGGRPLAARARRRRPGAGLLRQRGHRQHGRLVDVEQLRPPGRRRQRTRDPHRRRTGLALPALQGRLRPGGDPRAAAMAGDAGLARRARVPPGPRARHASRPARDPGGRHQSAHRGAVRRPDDGRPRHRGPAARHRVHPTRDRRRRAAQ